MVKATKKGKNVTQVGNFFVKKENDYFKFYDVNGIWSMRVHQMNMMYTFIEICLEQKNMDLLETIVKMNYLIGTTPPDVELIGDVYKAYVTMMERFRKVSTPEEDEQNLQTAKQMYEGQQTLKKMMENDRSEHDTPGQPL